MKVKYWIAIFWMSLGFISSAQDQELIKKYVREQFDVPATFGLEYNTGDFAKVLQKRTPPEPPSLQKIEQLHDSLRISYNANYLARIGYMYKRMNMKAKGETYLREALKVYQEKLDKKPGDLNATKEMIMLNVELGDLSKAVEINEKLLKISPSDTIFYLFRSFLYLNNGDMKEAVVSADKTLSKFPGNPDIYLYKTCALIFQELREIQSSKKFGESKSSFSAFKTDFSYLDKIPAKLKKNPEVELSMVANKFFKLFYKTMIPIFMNPPDSILHYKFVLNRQDSIELLGYEKQFLKLSQYPDFKNQYVFNYSLGVIYVLKNEHDKAIEYFKKSIAAKSVEFRDIQNNVSSSYENIIACYLNADDKKNAELWTKKKIDELASVTPVAADYISYATFQLMKGDLQSGKEWLLKAIGIDSSAAEAYAQLANVFMIEGDMASAGFCLETCYNLNPDLPSMYASIIFFRLLQDEKENARSVIELLLDFNPENEFVLRIKSDFFKE